MRKQVSLTLDSELVKKIDSDRTNALGEVPRSQAIENILKKHYEEKELGLIRS